MLLVVLVVIIVVIIAALVALRNFVEHDAKDVDIAFLEQGLGLAGFVGADVAAADDEDDAVGLAADDGGVGDDEDGRQVEQDVVVVIFDALQKLLHLRRAKQFGGVRRDRAARHDVEVRVDVVLNDVGKLQVVGEAVRQAAVWQAEAAVHDGAAQVAVDEQDALVVLAHDDGEVGIGRRLALARQGRGEDDCLDFLVPRCGELEVRADGTVCLGDWR